MSIYAQQDVRDHINQLRQMDGKTPLVVSGALEVIQQNLDALAASTTDLAQSLVVNNPVDVNVTNIVNQTLTRIDITDAKYGGKSDNGTTDNSVPFALAYADAQTMGGAEIFFPPNGSNFYGFEAPLELTSDVPTRLLGVGSLLGRMANMTAGHGWVNITGQNIHVTGLTFDGKVTTSTVMTRTTNGTPGNFATGGQDDPMHANLVLNSTFWLHGGVKNVQIDYYNINHSGGYAVLIDARFANVENVVIANGVIENCRAHTFKYSGSASVYGSWTGGVHYEGDGSLFGVKNLYFQNNKVRRVTGEAFWGHAAATSLVHENIYCQNNSIEDTGLDGIQYGVTRGGACTGNLVHRSGQITTDDSSTPIPRWQPAISIHLSLPAVAIDTTGVVVGVTYANNQIINPNGGAIDADGFGSGVISGNIIYISKPGEALYTADNVATFGPGSDGTNWCYGIQISNSNNLADAGANVSITNNVINNTGGGAINLAASRGCNVSNNKIDVAINRRFDNGGATGPNANPIRLINIGVGPNQRTTDTAVVHNTLTSGSGAVFAAVLEDEGNGIVFTGSERNYIGANLVIPTSSGMYEFQRATSSASTTAITLSSGASGMAQKSATLVQREGTGLAGTAATKFYYQEGPAAAVQHASLQAFSRTSVNNPLWNISANGGANTGAITTGNRTSVGFDDTVQTGRGYFDGFIAITDSTLTYPNDTAADLLPVTGEAGSPTLTMRYNSAADQLEIATTKSGGHRVYVVVGSGGGGGAGNPAAPFTSVQFNASGVFGGSSNFAWDNTSHLLTITGLTGTPGLSMVTSYVQSDEGFYTTSASATAVHVPNGTIDGLFGTFHGTTGYNDLQVPSGGIKAKRVTLERAGLPATTDWPGVVFTDGVDVAKGRIFNTSAKGGVNRGTLFLTANTTLNQGTGNWVQDDASIYSALWGFSPNYGYPITMYIQPPGGSLQLCWAVQTNLDFCVPARLVVGTVTFGDSSGAVQYVNGFISATNGYYSVGSASNCVNIPNGGVAAKSLSASGGLFNDIQTATGGVFAHLSLASETGVQLKSTSSTPGFTPSGGFSAIVHKAGSTWWHYNTVAAAWQSVDLAAIGGGAVTSVTASTNITVSPTTGAVVVGMSATPTFTSVTIGGFTLSNPGFGQLSNSGDFSAVNLVARGSSFNSIQTAGAIQSTFGYYVGSTQILDSSGHFVVNPANFSGGAIFGGGIQTTGYNIAGGYFGQTTSFPDNNGITRYFRGGVLVQGP